MEFFRIQSKIKEIQSIFLSKPIKITCIQAAFTSTQSAPHTLSLTEIFFENVITSCRRLKLMNIFCNMYTYFFLVTSSHGSIV